MNEENTQPYINKFLSGLQCKLLVKSGEGKCNIHVKFTKKIYICVVLRHLTTKKNKDKLRTFKD